MIVPKVPSTSEFKQVVMKLRTAEESRRAVASLSGTKREPEAATHGGALARALAEGAIESVEPLFVPSKSRDVGERLLASITEESEDDIAGLNVVRLREDADPRRTAQMLAEDQAVEYAHVIPERYLMRRQWRRHWRRHRAAAADPQESLQWGLQAIDVYRARLLAGFVEADDITVAVIDTGVDSSHPDLAGVVVDEQTFTSGPLKDKQGHGTHVIGIIAAVRDNDVGIAGVCRSQKVMSLKALGPYDGPGYYRAIRYATDNDAKVLSLSLGGEYDPTEELLITRAIENGLIVVAAMGNEFQLGNPTSYPAAIDGVIAVGASTKADGRARFSNTGEHIDLVAPGVDILSTIPTYPCELSSKTDYDAWDGTSMATPFVAGAVALLLANGSEPTLEDVRRALTRGCQKVPGQHGFSDEFGAGRLNVKRALRRI